MYSKYSSLDAFILAAVSEFSAPTTDLTSLHVDWSGKGTVIPDHIEGGPSINERTEKKNKKTLLTENPKNMNPEDGPNLNQPNPYKTLSLDSQDMEDYKRSTPDPRVN
jgi:hypothetical protein